MIVWADRVVGRPRCGATALWGDRVVGRPRCGATARVAPTEPCEHLFTLHYATIL
jgi:hypothetical protein